MPSLICSLNFFFAVPLSGVTVAAMASGSPTVGQRYNITCTILYPEGITSPVSVSWYDSVGTLSNGTDIAISTTQVSSTSVSSVLEFNPFRTVHGGRFSCTASLLSQTPPFNISQSAEVDIIVGGTFH